MIRIGVIILLALTLGIAGGAQACIEMRCPTCPQDDPQPAAVADVHDCCQKPGDSKSGDSKPTDHQSSDHSTLKICCSGACAMIVESSPTTASEKVVPAIAIEPVAPLSLASQPTTPPPRV